MEGAYSLTNLSRRSHAAACLARGHFCGVCIGILVVTARFRRGTAFSIKSRYYYTKEDYFPRFWTDYLGDIAIALHHD